MRIVLFTASGHRNIGDELILAEEVRYLSARYPDADIRVATYDAASVLATGVRVFSYFPNGLCKRPFSNIGYAVRTVWEIMRADMIVVGGWGLIYDDESGQSFRKLLREWRFRLFFAHLFWKPVFWCAVGVYVRPERIPMLRSLFHKTRIAVSVRDEHSQKMLWDIGINSKIIRDPVHLYMPQDLRISDADIETPLVGLALRRWYLPDDGACIRDMIRSIRDRGYEPVFCSHSLHDRDESANDFLSYRDIAAELRVRITMSMEETRKQYPRLHSMITMRLHAHILALVHHTPLISLSYSQKTDALLEIYAYPHHMRAREYTSERFCALFDSVCAQTSEIRFALERKSATIRDSVHTALDDFFP